MHNIHDLERRWLSYKIKSFIPHILISLMVIISFMLVISIYSKNSTSSQNKDIVLNNQLQQPVSKKIISKVKVLPVKKIKLPSVEPDINHIAPKTIQKQDATPILNPSMDFIKNLRSSSSTSYKSNSFKTDKQEPDVKEEQVKIKENVIVEKTKLILIQRQETQSDINHVIARFKKNKNPALSLFIAKKYYKLGDYKQSYNYALLTNQINSGIEQSWIIFAKSLVKLGKKDKAIYTLEKYIKSSKSVNAKMLLDNIKSGKFK